MIPFAHINTNFFRDSLFFISSFPFHHHQQTVLFTLTNNKSNKQMSPFLLLFFLPLQLYVSVNGNSTTCERTNPCTLETAMQLALDYNGDSLINLFGGTYENFTFQCESFSSSNVALRGTDRAPILSNTHFWGWNNLSFDNIQFLTTKLEFEARQSLKFIL